MTLRTTQQDGHGVVVEDAEETPDGQSEGPIGIGHGLLERLAASGHGVEGPEDGRDPEEQAHGMTDDDAHVAVEDRHGRDHEREAQHEDELHDHDERIQMLIFTGPVISRRRRTSMPKRRTHLASDPVTGSTILGKGSA
jgi:hypothetical protein